MNSAPFGHGSEAKPQVISGLPSRDRRERCLKFLPLLAFLTALAGCRARQPSVELTKVPASAEGTPFRLEDIEGRVTGAKPGQQIVLYAKSGMVWWVQPLLTHPFTPVQPDSTWRSSTHPGTEYAALLVDPSFIPPLTTRELPKLGGPVAALAIVKGTGSPPVIPARKIVQFSGYDWEIRRQPSSRGAKPAPYNPANAWVDERGFLHLRTSRQGEVWAGAEARLTHSLGQGLYQFTVRDVSRLEPAHQLAMFTWDDLAADQHHREVDMEIGRWGDPAMKNAQFAIQPADEPANVVRYETPPGQITYTFRWEPGKVAFKTLRGPATISSHEFTSGVPSPGGESVNISVYVLESSKVMPHAPCEVIIEKFEYLP